MLEIVRVMLMALILYLPVTDEPANQLYKIVKRAASKRKVELCRSIHELSERLSRPLFNFHISILFAADRKDLLAITSLGHFLSDMRIILVLPDHDPETIAKGHLLRPRFILWLDDDFTQMEIILKRMINLYDDPIHRMQEYK